MLFDVLLLAAVLPLSFVVVGCAVELAAVFSVSRERRGL